MKNICLTLGMNQGNDEVKISNKICGCRFRFDQSMRTGIGFELQMVCNLLMCDDDDDDDDDDDNNNKKKKTH